MNSNKGVVDYLTIEFTRFNIYIYIYFRRIQD